jgi:plasmid replication initiation protein
MTLTQFRLASYLIALVYVQSSKNEVNFDIKRYCEICGIDYRSGFNYEQVKYDIKRLADRSLWVESPTDPRAEVLVRLIQKSWIYEQSGVIKIRLDEDVKQYIMHLAQQYEEKGLMYTTYAFMYTLPMRSLYSMRLYELLKSWVSVQSAEEGRWWYIDNLQELLGSKYERYQDFRRKVIEKAIDEINRYTDINVTAEPIKEGRSYTIINFYIVPKDKDEILSLQGKINRLIEGWPFATDGIAPLSKPKKKKSAANDMPIGVSFNADNQSVFRGFEDMPEPPAEDEQKPKKRGRKRKENEK